MIKRTNGRLNIIKYVIKKNKLDRPGSPRRGVMAQTLTGT
jgi:hypothetical protein